MQPTEIASKDWPEQDAQARQPAAVVMCTWNRIERLPKTIEMLKAQVGCDVQLFIWNNNPEIAADVERTIAESEGLPVSVRHSPENVGGFGRFYYARELADQFPEVIFIDDDNEFDEYAMAALLEESKAETAHAAWAFNFKTGKHYWDRSPAAPHQSADYCATRGLVCDTAAFTDGRLFECPEPYWFIEDLWLSYFLNQVKGYATYKSAVEMPAPLDAKGQALPLLYRKIKFLRYLTQERGWRINAEKQAA